MRRIVGQFLFLLALAGLVGCVADTKLSDRSNFLNTTLTTYAGQQVIGYPVGVFNINDQLIGIAYDDNDYVTIWNGDAANLNYGFLEQTKNQFQFKILFRADQTVEEKPIRGMRFFQFEISSDRLDSFTFPVHSVVDFGDGLIQKFDTVTPWDSSLQSYRVFTGQVDHFIGVSRLNTFGFGLYLSNPVYAAVKTYADNSTKTVTVYHSDNDYYFYNDNMYSPSTATELDNLRGNLPLRTKGMQFTSTTRPTFNTFNNLNLLEIAPQIEYFNMRDGDGINYFNNYNFQQSYYGSALFFFNKLEAIDFGSHSSVVDGVTVMDRLEGQDLVTVFPMLRSFAIRQGQYSDNLNFKIPNFKTVLITNDGTGTMTADDFDRILIELDGVKTDMGGILCLFDMTRTAASDAAYYSLLAKGVSIRTVTWTY